MKYLNSTLIKNSLIKLYGKDRYQAIVDWFKPRINEYNEMIRRANI
jgi:hypothetical protein